MALSLLQRHADVLRATGTLRESASVSRMSKDLCSVRISGRKLPSERQTPSSPPCTAVQPKSFSTVNKGSLPKTLE